VRREVPFLWTTCLVQYRLARRDPVTNLISRGEERMSVGDRTLKATVWTVAMLAELLAMVCFGYAVFPRHPDLTKRQILSVSVSNAKLVSGLTTYETAGGRLGREFGDTLLGFVRQSCGLWWLNRWAKASTKACSLSIRCGRS